MIFLKHFFVKVIIYPLYHHYQLIEISRSITDLPNEEICLHSKYSPLQKKFHQEEINKLKFEWEAKNYNDLHNWCQKMKCRIEINQDQLRNKKFKTTLRLINQNGLFEEEIITQGEGHSKKESKTLAMRNLMNKLIDRNFINLGYLNITVSSLTSSLNDSKEYKNEKKLQNELIKQISASSSKTYTANIDKLKELKIIKPNLEWFEISYIWYYAIINCNINCIKQLLLLVYSSKDNTHLSSQIKEEMINSLIFASDYRFAIDVLNEYFEVVNYNSDYLLCGTYYKQMKKLYYIELLDTLSLIKEKFNNKDNKFESIDAYGTISILGFRFAQLVISFTPELNITNISLNYKDKYITKKEIVYIENSKTKERSIGIVNSINSNNAQVKIRAINREDISNSNTLSTDTFRIIKIMNYFIYKKTLEALDQFCHINTNVDIKLRKIIYGDIEYSANEDKNNCIKYANEEVIELPNDFKIGSQQLNLSQQEALIKALKQRLTLIQGPPGTGKTTTAIELIIEWLKIDNTTQILLCAESNCALDILYNELLIAGIPAYRYGWKESFGKCDKESEYCVIKNKINTSNVICATCVGSYNDFFKEISFERVIIDEATQANELSSLIPLLHNCKQLVLIGDHKQLSPTVISYQAQIKGLGVSLFEKLNKFGIKPQLLKVQYRMHSSISAFPTEFFYNGQLLNGIPDENIIPVKGIKWPHMSQHIGFIDIKGKEELDIQTNSYYNQIELNVIMSLMMNILPANTDISIGIITPYDAQKRRLIISLKKTFPYSFDINNSLSVDTVDGFQGMEKDLIIVSLVRSNDKSSIGFLSDKRRINVTLTRARSGLVVIGNSSCMKSDNTWNEWLKYIDKHKLYINF